MDLLEQREGAWRHPWETVRAEFFAGLVGELSGVAGAVRVLDAGAGDAWFASRLVGTLPPGSDVTCWDVNYRDEDLARDRAEGVTLVREAPAGTFDVLLMLDVIEHVEDDAAFLDELIGRNLAPGGLLVVSAPAFASLYSAHDAWLGHHRRYRPARLRELVGARVDVVEHGPLFVSLLPARAAAVAVERIRRGAPEQKGVGAWTGGKWSTALATSALRLDARIGRVAGRVTGYPGGLSYWVAGRRA